MSAEKSKVAGRTRNYATVVYPDSAPENWREILNSFMVPVFISPLHDKDINPDGKPKKPHYHVLLMYEGPKTREQAHELFKQINGVGCEVVNSLRGYARYLCHLDNPEKHQYEKEDVICMCGSDYANVIGLPTDKYKALAEMMAFCDVNCIDSFYKLSNYAAESRMDWFRVLADSGSVFMREWLRSKSWTEDKEKAEREANNEI